MLALAAAASGARDIFGDRSPNGVSTIWLATVAAWHGGRVTGSEIIPERAASANVNLAEAGLAGSAEVLAGDARELLAGFGRPIDLSLIDAEMDGYADHFAATGLILADNLVSHD